MGELLLHADLELFLSGYFQAGLAARPEPYCADVVVGRDFPPADLLQPGRFIVIRDDSGPRTSIITKDVTVGITVKAPTISDVKALAAMVEGLLPGCVGVEPGTPVAALLGVNGPYSVPDPGGGPTQYLTAEFTVVATVL